MVFPTLEHGLRRLALVLGVAFAFLIWSGAIDASPASAAKLSVGIRGSINNAIGTGLNGLGWGSVVETTSSARINCTFPTDSWCTADYGIGWEVELRADAPEGWRFDHWIQGGNGEVTCDSGTATNVCRFRLWFWDLYVGAYFVDETAPDAVMDSAPPAATNDPNAHFTFHSPDQSQYNPVTFLCRTETLDPPLQTLSFGCNSGMFGWPVTYDGHYRMKLLTYDASSNADPTPPVVEFTVDTVPPDTSIDSSPSDTWKTSATFGFSGNDPNGRWDGSVAGSGVTGFQCRLDGGSWSACTSGVGYDNLAQGSHTFEVRAVDAAGNADQSPATRTWTVSTPQCHGNYATIVGTNGNDVLNGTAVADVIVGLGGNDLINGLAGDDVVCGGDGNDTLRGRAGADQLDGGAGADVADYKSATAGVTVNLSTRTASGGDGSDSLASIESVYGSQYADTLTGSGYADSLFGFGGADKLNGLGGNDLLRGGLAADSLDGGLGVDTADYQLAPSAVTVNLSTAPGTASGGDGADPSLLSIESVIGSPYADSLTGSPLADTLNGLGGNDVVSGLGGNDVLTGGPGADQLKGGDNGDTLYARDGVADSVDGGPGIGDRAQTDSSRDAVTGVETTLP